MRIIYFLIGVAISVLIVKLWPTRNKKQIQSFTPPTGPDPRIKLIPGKKYKVVKPFTDYDKEVHEVGQTWTFVTTNFLPYEDGLTVHITLPDNPAKVLLFRLQWRPEEQAEIIENFTDYVAPFE